MASPIRCTWVWLNFGSWWWTGRPGVLRFMGSRRVKHDWATELNWTELNWKRQKKKCDAQIAKNVKRACVPPCQWLRKLIGLPIIATDRTDPANWRLRLKARNQKLKGSWEKKLPDGEPSCPTKAPRAHYEQKVAYNSLQNYKKVVIQCAYEGGKVGGAWVGPLATSPLGLLRTRISKIQTVAPHCLIWQALPTWAI